MSTTRNKAQRPVSGRIYTAKEIETSLDLLDSPFYMVPLSYWPHLLGSHTGSRNLPIQTSSMTVEEQLAVPLFAGTLWSYVRTTSEWIPVFNWAEPNVSPRDFLDVYIDDGRTDDDEGKYVLMMKGQTPPWPGNFRCVSVS